VTDHPTHDYDDQAVSNRLGRHQHTLDDSLDSVLDIEAGLREVLIHSRHDTAVDALGTVLNTEAGLACILPPTPQPQASDTSGTRGNPRAGDLPFALSPADRMALRDHPDVKAAQQLLSRDLDHDLDRDLSPLAVRARAIERAMTLGRDLARALARDLTRILARDLSRPHSRARDFVRDIDLARDRARALDVDFARVLARDAPYVVDSGVHFARSRARDLNLDLDSIHSLDRLLGVGLGFGLALDRARARDLTRLLDLVLDYDLDHDVFIEIRTNEVCRAIGSALHREPPLLDAASVLMLLDDFTHDDLRDTDLRGIDFSGVHWSQRTQWPAVVDLEALKARSDETPPGSGIWIVRSGTTTVRDFADLT
jgi:hypothetical protein